MRLTYLFLGIFIAAGCGGSTGDNTSGTGPGAPAGSGGAGDGGSGMGTSGAAGSVASNGGTGGSGVGGAGEGTGGAGDAGSAGASGSGDSGAPGMGGGGAGGSAGAPDGYTLTGQWAFTGTQSTKTTAGTITLSANEITIDSSGGVLSLTRHGDTLTLGYADADESQQATGSQTGAGTASFGAFPFDLSGTISFSEVVKNPNLNVGTCSGSLGATALDANCTNVGPSPKPAPGLNGTMSAARSAPAASIFGDLGGKWTGGSSEGGICMLTIEGTAISSHCVGGYFAGDFTIVFSGDMASGTTSEGVEFSAQRL